MGGQQGRAYSMPCRPWCIFHFSPRKYGAIGRFCMETWSHLQSPLMLGEEQMGVGKEGVWGREYMLRNGLGSCVIQDE